MITPEIISAGMDAGIVRIIDSPNSKEPACKIGESWFYFAGEAGAGHTADEYLAVTPREDVIHNIIDALNDIYERVYKVEYLYYEAILREKLSMSELLAQNPPTKKSIRITYYVRCGNKDIEAYITLPMLDYYADDLLRNGSGGYAYRSNIGGILTRLATIQGNIYSGYFTAEEEQKT